MQDSNSKRNISQNDPLNDELAEFITVVYWMSFIAQNIVTLILNAKKKNNNNNFYLDWYPSQDNYICLAWMRLSMRYSHSGSESFDSHHVLCFRTCGVSLCNVQIIMYKQYRWNLRFFTKPFKCRPNSCIFNPL